MTQKLLLALIQSEWVQIAVIGMLVKWLASWWQTATGAKWKKWEGIAITAVKAAEKAIPDDTLNKGARRLNEALLTFCQKYEAATGVKPNDADLAQIENLIGVVHSQLESKDQL
jgi:hypothetical protein